MPWMGVTGTHACESVSVSEDRWRAKCALLLCYLTSLMTAWSLLLCGNTWDTTIVSMQTTSLVAGGHGSHHEIPVTPECRVQTGRHWVVRVELEVLPSGDRSAPSGRHHLVSTNDEQGHDV